MYSVKKFLHQWLWLILLAFLGVGLFYPPVGVIALACMLAPVITAFFKGRMWCGSFCPRGSFNDTILSRISRKVSVPKVLKSKGLRLAFMVLLMGAFAVQISFAWGDINAVGKVFVRMIAITTLITVVLGTVYSQRAWCMVCPIGTMAHYASKFNMSSNRSRNIVFEKNKCINCKICSRSCPMGIDVLSFKEQGKVLHADCLKCGVCVGKCPKKSLDF